MKTKLSKTETDEPFEIKCPIGVGVITNHFL